MKDPVPPFEPRLPATPAVSDWEGDESDVTINAIVTRTETGKLTVQRPAPQATPDSAAAIPSPEGSSAGETPAADKGPDDKR